MGVVLVKDKNNKYIDTVRTHIMKTYQMVFLYPQRYIKENKVTDEFYKLANATADNISREIKVDKDNVRDVIIAYGIELYKNINKSPYDKYVDYADKAVTEIYKRAGIDYYKDVVNIISEDVNTASAFSNSTISKIFPLLKMDVQKQLAQKILKERIAPTYFNNIVAYDKDEDKEYRFYFNENGSILYVFVNGQQFDKVSMPIPYIAISPFFDLITDEQKSLFALANKVYRIMYQMKDPVYAIISKTMYDAFGYEGNIEDLSEDINKKIDGLTNLSRSAKSILKQVLNAGIIWMITEKPTEMELEDIADNTYKTFVERIHNEYKDISL